MGSLNNRKDAMTIMDFGLGDKSDEMTPNKDKDLENLDLIALNWIGPWIRTRLI